MKKIISALAIGAVAAGAAFAEMNVTLKYRNGLDILKYEKPGLGKSGASDYNQGSTTTWFALNGLHDYLDLNASGDIFSLHAGIKPTGGDDNLKFNILQLGAKWNGFFFESGWHADGIMNFRVKKDQDNGNESADVFEAFKLGSAWSTDGSCSNNQVSFGTARDMYALVGYNADLGTLAGAEGLSVKVQGAVMSDRWWEKTVSGKDGEHSEERDGNKGWAVFINPRKDGLFEAELFLKGIRIGKDDDKQELVMGAYAKPLGIDVLADSAVGGSLVVLDGTVQEWNLDLRAYLKLSDALTVTSHNKFAHLCSTDTNYTMSDGAAVSTGLAGLSALKSSQVLWNLLAARYVINPTVTGVLAAGQITDFDSQTDKCDGTQIFVHPHAQIFAAANASVTAGVLLGFNGIGADEKVNKDVDVLVKIPVLFRVKM